MTAAAGIRAVFLGGPGAGKGTQAQRLAASGIAAHISTGDMLRAHVADGTDLGKQARGYMDSGRLVPDDVIIAMVMHRIAEPDARGSWILDGFPRTLPQAEALEANLSDAGQALSHVVHFAVPHEDLVARLTGRRTCGSCGAIWHVQFQPTARESVCDRCGGALVQRADDRIEAVEKRLQVYRTQTEPLLAFYRDQGTLVEVDASRPRDEVYRQVESVLALAGRSTAHESDNL